MAEKPRLLSCISILLVILMTEKQYIYALFQRLKVPVKDDTDC